MQKDRGAEWGICCVELYHAFIVHGLFERLQSIICAQDWQVRSCGGFFSWECVLHGSVPWQRMMSDCRAWRLFVALMHLFVYFVSFFRLTSHLVIPCNPPPHTHTHTHRPWLVASGSSQPWISS